METNSMVRTKVKEVLLVVLIDFQGGLVWFQIVHDHQFYLAGCDGYGDSKPFHPT